LSLGEASGRPLIGVLICALGLAATGCGAGPSAGSSSAPNPSAGTSCSLTVDITASAGSASAWGTVSATTAGSSYTFSRPSQTVSVSCGSLLQFRQTPTNSTTWRFREWRIQGASDTRARTSLVLSTVVNGVDRVSAVYVAVGSASSPTPAPSAN